MAMHEVHETPYGWVIVAAAFVVHVLTYGIAWSAGVFNAIFLHAFEDSKVVTAWAAALISALMYASGPISSMLTNRYGCRKIVMLGGLLTSLGLSLSYFASNIYYLYVSFGILTGVGCGLAYIPTVTTIPQFFSRRLALATGLTVSGVGVGTFAIPPLVRLLANKYDWEGTLLILGGICLNIVVCGALMRPNTRRQLDTIVIKAALADSKLDVRDPEPEPKTLKPNRYMALSVFKKVGFVCLCFNNLLVCFGLSIVYVHLSAFSEAKGIDGDRSALLMSTIGITNLLGRFLYGIVAQHKKVDAFIFYAGSFALAGVAVGACPLVHSFIPIVVLASIFGFLTGCFGTLLPVMLLKLIGVERFANGYGCLLLFEALGTLSGAPFAGFLFDVTQSYNTSFYLGGACIMFSSVFMIAPILRMRRKRQPVYTTPDRIELINEQYLIDEILTSL